MLKTKRARGRPKQVSVVGGGPAWSPSAMDFFTSPSREDKRSSEGRFNSVNQREENIFRGERGSVRVAALPPLLIEIAPVFMNPRATRGCQATENAVVIVRGGTLLPSEETTREMKVQSCLEALCCK